jgi:phosphatidate cytidylyltransferase
MVYKNLYNRLFLSLLFFAFYFFAMQNKNLIFIFGSIIYLFVLYEIIKNFNKVYFYSFFYLLSSYLFFILYFFIFFDFIIFNIFIFAIIIFDSSSYFIGKVFGKTYIFKYLSPQKTLEGYLGGIILTNLSYIIFYYFKNIEFKITILIILINLTILISILGDLIESYFKRQNFIKDSSNYLPGHGGFFDRFDSFIASIIMLTIFSLFY